MARKQQRLTCAGCGKFITGKDTGPCKSCGHSVRSLYLGENLVVVEGARKFTSTKNFSEKRPWLFYLVWAVTLLSPFLGLVLLGWIGVFAGLLIGVGCQFAGGYAQKHIREVSSWTDS